MLRGHLKFMVLNLIKEEPTTGYSLIKRIKERTGWKPSYGSIYPVLEGILKEGLVSTKTKGRKKTYTLTKKGIEFQKKGKEQKKQMLKEMFEQFNMLQNMCDVDVDFHEYLFDEMVEGNPPFRELTGLVSDARAEIIRIIRSGLLGRNNAKVRAILNESTASLRKIR